MRALCFTLLLAGFVRPASAQFSSEKLREGLVRFRAFAAPLVEAKGRRLRLGFDHDWKLGFGTCGVEKGVVVIEVGATVNEFPGFRPEHLDVILCHELGHFLGEAPKKENVVNDEGDWASGEGESDYFAGSCLRRYRRIASPCRNLEESLVDPSCRRVLEAGEGFFRLLHAAYAPYTDEPTPSLLKKDPSVVEKTELNHVGNHQCRVDSFVAGFLSEPRPRCWYKP